jgi:type VI secretion system secreted protein VgrG
MPPGERPGREAINELFYFEFDALSVSPGIDLNQLIREKNTIARLQADVSSRAWHGLCMGAAWLGADM